MASGSSGYGVGAGFDGRGRRGRRRAPLIVGVVLLLLVGVVVAVGVAVHSASQDRARKRSLAQATATVDSFLTAWGKGDANAMASMATTDTAAYVRSEIPQLARSLQITTASYAPGPVSATTDPGASFTGQVVVQGLGTWRPSSRLTLQKDGGVWKVAFTPQTVTPELTAGGTLARRRTPATRGTIRAADGTPLVGVDGELDGNLLGTTGHYTAAQAQAAGPAFATGDLGGIGGLQRAYNGILAGRPGGSLRVLDSAGGTAATLLSQPTTAGRDVRLSIDLTTQHAAERALASLPAAQTGSLVAIDLRTGGILALGNHPYNAYGRAILGRYPAGSTFKIITSTAGLLSGDAPSTTLPCGATTTAGGVTFKNAEKEVLGPISFTTAFAKSCNTAFINLEKTLPAGAFARAAALYGMSPLTASQAPQPLPIHSFGGSVPPPTDAADAAAQAIGQGKVLVSPLQMASVAAAVGSGTWRQPFVTATTPAGEPSHVLPAGVAATLRTFMAAVVASGTAAGSGLPAGTYGKTGTAEYGSGAAPPTVAWFVGFRGDVAFACQVGGDTMSGGFGASTAAPVVARFLRSLG